jgi:thioredoxin 1
METLDDLKGVLEENAGVIILKFEADWCGPCKKIKPYVGEWVKRLPPTVKYIVVNIDDSLEIYATLKNKRMVSGIPSLVAYRKGNVSLIPDERVSGSDPAGIDQFFKNILQG